MTAPSMFFVRRDADGRSGARRRASVTSDEAWVNGSRDLREASPTGPSPRRLMPSPNLNSQPVIGVHLGWFASSIGRGDRLAAILPSRPCPCPRSLQALLDVVAGSIRHHVRVRRALPRDQRHLPGRYSRRRRRQAAQRGNDGQREQAVAETPRAPPRAEDSRHISTVATGRRHLPHPARVIATTAARARRVSARGTGSGPTRRRRRAAGRPGTRSRSPAPRRAGRPRRRARSAPCRSARAAGPARR